MTATNVRRLLSASACLAAAALVAVGCSSGGDQPTSKAEQEAKKAQGFVKPKEQPTAQMKAVLDELAALKPRPIDALEPAEARKQPTATDAVVALLKKQGKPTTPNDGVTIENRTIPGAEGELKARVYTPANVVANAPLVVYFRGGGWVIATLDTYEPSCRALAAMSGAKVISVNYRQAPEHTFPAAHEDAYASFQWAVSNAASLGCDPAKVAVVGESAGGNLAAATCLMARDRGGKLPVAAVMVYPVSNTEAGTPSQLAYTDAKPLNTGALPWFLKYYAPSSEARNSPYLAILKDKGSLAKFPPSTVITAGIDPLHSEAEAWAAKLKEGGVDVKYVNYPGVTHEFFGMGAVLDEAKAAEKVASDRLKAAFAMKK